MKQIVSLASIVCVLLFATAPATAADKARVFKAGAATSNITPRLGTSMNGGMQDRAASHVHDDLHARCLVLDDGKTRLAIVLCDTCLLPREVADAAKKLANHELGLPVENILIAATHTHSGGTLTPAFQSDPDPVYPPFVVRRIADGFRRAVNNLAPAKIGWGACDVPDEVFNRRWKLKEGTMPPNPFGKIDQVKMNPGVGNPNLVEPAGPTDPEVSIVSVVSPDGRPIALLANYSLHYCGGTTAGAVSADYFGVFADRIQQLLKADRLDPPFVGIMSNGTSGDINNVNCHGPAAKFAPYEKMRKVAHHVADEVMRVYPGIRHRDGVPLAMRQTEIKLGVRKPSADEVARAKEIMAKAKKAPVMTTAEEIYARETVQMAGYPDEVSIILQALRIGDLAITAIPCEVFAEIGLELKKKSPIKPEFTIQLANGYNGYLPTPAQHALGGYETWRAKSSYLEVGASPKITAKLLELLAQLK